MNYILLLLLFNFYRLEDYRLYNNNKTDHQVLGYLGPFCLNVCNSVFYFFFLFWLTYLFIALCLRLWYNISAQIKV